MMSNCDAVAERVALGEAIGDLADHVASCERCQRLVAMPGQLGATRHAIDPGLGFTARMTAGAQHRIAVRRRRRIVAGFAATAVAGVFGVFVMTREAPPAGVPQQAVEVPQPTPPDERADDAAPLDDAELEALVDLADTKRSSRLSAHWARIQRPLAPYKQLVKGVTP